MGRYKNIEIKGLLIKDFEKIFEDSLNSAIKSSKLTEEEALKKIAPKFKKLLSGFEETMATFYVDRHKFDLDNFLKISFRNQTKVAKTHRKSFVAFILYVNGCYEVYRQIIAKIKRKKIDSTLKMTVSLYGLIVRRADEIVHQLLSAYTDVAMIIWRSLYENAIVLLVLAIENDPKLADKYFQHSVRNARKKILSYNKNYKELKFKPLSSSTEKILMSEVRKAEIRHGKEFLENEYGWADDLFPGNQKASLRLLEERVEMNRFRPYYLLCCEHIHPSFNSFKDYMEGNKIILPRILRQEIDLDKFIDPMQFTLSILHEINDYILYEFSVAEEYNINKLLMRKVFEKQQDTFIKPKRKRANS